ncbi:MFS transporter [Sandaracinobacter sp. RS1-74]|uniref:MFS transporter n=1 Tax=Sandaracinobacteroides sayramensis TaxID=2913411 RepID=UPI001EDC63AA|nr:MFS transporter [Sandaracinobacteroides sayramensis]MCG2840636.1 MFS transporter [Sandaracinobacteroides sayramensis]
MAEARSAIRAGTLAGPRLGFYALGGFGTGVLTTVPAVLLLYFSTEVLGMPPGLAALVVLLPKLWAILWDPLVGAWSDRIRSRLGRRRPFILAGTVGGPIFFLLLFGWPYPQGAAAFVPVLLLYLLMTSFYSVFAVPFVAVPAEASDDAAVRERITGWRIGFAMIGVFTGAAAAPAIAAAAGGGRHGYQVMAAVIAALCAAALASSFLATPSHFRAMPDAGSRPPFRLRALAERTARFWRLTGVYVLQLVGVGVVTALTPYWVVHVAKRSDGDAGLALGAMFLMTILTVPLWMAGIRRWTAGAMLGVSAAMFGAAALLLALPGGGPMLATYMLLGIPFAGIQLGAFALVAHVIHALAGEREGLFTGIWTAGEKSGLALGAALAGLGLQLGGFVSAAPEQSEAAIHSLRWLIAAGPMACMAFSLALLWKEMRR